MNKATAFGRMAAGLGAIALGVFGIGWASSDALAASACESLATELLGNPVIKSVTSAKTTTPAPANVQYCRVTLVYGTDPGQNITIAVGLPLSAADGGTGGIQGAWNGRTEGLGGGGCSGNLNVNAAVNAGYVGSGTDGGHSGGDCTPGVNPDGTYNLGFIEDFFRVGIKQEILWSKQIATTYYGKHPVYNYWNGCSTGGRQGYLLAQELGDELDGIVANAPAMYWTRFQTAQMWGEIAMFELAGEAPQGAIPPPKLAAVQKAAVNACDANDGAQDGIIDDPRTCNFDASANICGEPKAPAPPNCLTTSEAAAVNKIWDGPRNEKGNRIWFPLDRGTDFSILNGPAPFQLGVIQFEWNEKDPAYAAGITPGLFGPPPPSKWDTVTLAGPGLDYPQVAQDGSRNIADVTDTFGPLDTFKKHGGKMITFVGGNDQFIYPRGVLNYYRQMAARYQAHHDQTGFDGVQSFYRLFHAPGVGHCGAPVFALGTVGPWPVNGADFKALINWVENGVAPSQVLGSGIGSGTPPTPLTRPLCPYPQTAEYKGSGNVFDAANWACGGNLETTQVVCPDVLVRYKHEVKGNLDFKGSGVPPEGCGDQGDEHQEDDSSDN
jgi:hypothetical protein